MAANDYHFVTRWRIPGTCDEVYDVLGEPMELARWWPEVYLRVEEVEPGESGGIGRVIKLHTKGWLPYTLDWSFRVTRVHKPNGFALEAWGDFVGRGEWIFTQQGEDVDIVYDWRIVADKPLLKKLSFLLKPAFSANHRWAMAKGEAALRKELMRVRASRAGTSS